MKFIIILLGLVIVGEYMHAQEKIDTSQKIIKERKNSARHIDKPYLILISADGLRYDMAQKFQAKNMLTLGAQGVTSPWMIPSYPTQTFPNHYTIVTGLYPAHHGIVDNKFYDRINDRRYRIGSPAVVDSSWYGGTPIWVLAERDSMLTACFYWVGAEAAIQGIRPTYYYNFNHEIKLERRLEIVKEWLLLPSDRRPHLITFYLPHVDQAAHRFGPDAEQTKNAVLLIDDCIGKMNNMADSLGLPVNFILVSDHGMTKLSVDSVKKTPVTSLYNQ